MHHPGRRLPALDDFCLTVEPGQVVALHGRSGAGKSTVLSVLLGFVTPDAGLVQIDGRSVTEARPPMAWVPQHPRLPGRTVAEVLRLGDATASEEQLHDALADVGADFVGSLDDEVGTDGTRFSTGQRRRLALARALLHVRAGARVVLLDEPNEGLDAASATVVSRVVERLRGAATVLLVTHSPELAQLADRRVELAAPVFRPRTGAAVTA